MSSAPGSTRHRNTPRGGIRAEPSSITVPQSYSSYAEWPNADDAFGHDYRPPSLLENYERLLPTQPVGIPGRSQLRRVSEGSGSTRSVELPPYSRRATEGEISHIEAWTRRFGRIDRKLEEIQQAQTAQSQRLAVTANRVKNVQDQIDGMSPTLRATSHLNREFQRDVTTALLVITDKLIEMEAKVNVEPRMTRTEIAGIRWDIKELREQILQRESPSISTSGSVTEDPKTRKGTKRRGRRGSRQERKAENGQEGGMRTAVMAEMREPTLALSKEG